MIVPRFQAMFKRSRHCIKYIFMFSQEYYELPKQTIRASGNIDHKSKPKFVKEV